MFEWLKNKCEARGTACSCWFDRWGKYDWKECCIRHDTCVGKLVGDRSTKPCDSEFIKCLKVKAPVWLAYVMYGVVRITTRWYK